MFFGQSRTPGNERGWLIVIGNPMIIQGKNNVNGRGFHMVNHLFQSLGTKELKIFFDESGKGADRPNLLGSLSIPKKIYDESDEYRYYNQFLKRMDLKIHWNKYSGDALKRYNLKHLMELLLIYSPFIEFHVIHYHYHYLIGRENFQEREIENTIYLKFPERLIYGQMRGYGNEISVLADIFIEKGTEYKKMQLEQKMKEILNSHSLYRSGNFYTRNCLMLPKNSEIGLEMTDVLLGITRMLIQNPDASSNGKAAKIQFIMELLNNDRFLDFLKNITYFEWRGTQQLQRINFIDYINLFRVKHMKFH